MAGETYSLEHFYYGQMVRDGKPEAAMRVLAKSPGVSDEQAQKAVKQVFMPPMAGSSTGSWGITRGKAIPVLLVQAQLGASGQTILHYVIVPPDVLRDLSGNLRAWMTLVEETMPTYDAPDQTLELLQVTASGPTTTDEQTDDILDLMTFTKNRMDTMETLLSSIVKGVPLVVLGAPPVLDQRIKFISGLLALLPPPTRFGVTFATHSTVASQVEAQIRFMGDDVPPQNVMIYNWANAHLSGVEVEDDYSHFMISKLRLDLGLVIQQTLDLTEVAVWRSQQGDRLADAMAYASHRLKLDDALINNQPVEVDDVAEVLVQDPTLTDDLRVAYGRHLLTFSLALGDMSHADPVAVLLYNNPALAKLANDQIGDALNEAGKAGIIYEALLRWMSTPLGPQGDEWISLTHRAALMHLDALVEARDTDAIHDFLKAAESAGPGTAMRRIAPQITTTVTPLISDDAKLAERIFLFAAHHLDADKISKMLSAEAFVKRLPKAMRAIGPFLSGQADQPAPAGLLKDAAYGFEKNARALVALRLAEQAVQAGQLVLLDEAALEILFMAARSATGAEYRDMLLGIAHSFDDGALRDLGVKGGRAILQILLALGDYRDLAHEMIRQSRVLYPGDLQEKYLSSVRYVFAETPLNGEQALRAMRTIHEEGIKSVPFMVAVGGALAGSQWAEALQPLADETAVVLADNRELLEVMNAEAVLDLLQYYARRKNAVGTIRVAGLVPGVAAYQRHSGLAIMTQMYKLMAWHEEAKNAGLELLRRYIRRADTRDAAQAVKHFGNDLGADVQHSLHITYMIRRLMGGLDMHHYAQELHVVAEFLQDIAAAYVGRGNPDLNHLMMALKNISIHVPDSERHDLHEALITTGEAIIDLGKGYRAHSPRNQRHVESLLSGKGTAASALDVLRAMGGYFSRGAAAPFDLQSGDNPLRDRYTDSFVAEVMAASALLDGPLHAFPHDKPAKLAAQAIHDEMASLASGLGEAEARSLALDLQRVVELVDVIADKGDAKAMSDSSLGQKLDSGKQQPRSALELIRLMAGYFG